MRPASITAGSAVNICITGRGNKNSTSVNSSPAAAEMRSARLATRQMESTSFLPQYWLPQHDGAARHAEYGYGINKEHLVGQTGGRERHLAQPAQHQGIHQVDTVRNDILQRHRQCERQQAAVKRALYMNFRIFGLHGSPPASSRGKRPPGRRPFCFWEVMSV